MRPVVNFANRLKTKRGQSWGPRTISDCQLIFVISGQADVTIGPQAYRISSGECVFYGADSPHRIVSSLTDPVTFSSIHFSWDRESISPLIPLPEIKDCDERELQRQPASYFIHQDETGDLMLPHHCVLPELEPIFLKIVAEYRSEGYGYQASMRALLTQLLVQMLRHQRAGRSVSADLAPKIGPALEAIRKEPDVYWTTEQLARLCGYHPTYFAALFREVMGEKPKHFIVLERIKRAKQLLMEDITIEQTAHKLGYTSIHYFCRNFKEATGLTPTEFKRQMRLL
jgi:AraC-like DNA-binding protein